MSEVVRKDVYKSMIISFRFINFLFISAAVKDVIEVLWFKVAVVVDAGHWFSLT